MSKRLLSAIKTSSSGPADKRLALRILVAATLAGMAIGTIVGSVKPALHKATATIQINAPDLPARMTKYAEVSTPPSMETIYALATSDAVLASVREELDVEDLSISMLRRRITVDEHEAAFLVTVAYRDENPKRASTVANLLIATLTRHHHEQRISEIEAVINTLRKELEDQEDLLENARQRELDIAKRAGLSEGAVKYIRRRFLEDPSTLSADTRLTVNILLEYRETEISKQTKQLDALADLKGPLRFAKAAQLDIDDPAWQSLFPLYQRGQLELSALIDSDLGVEHPKVRAATNQLNKVSGMLEQVLDSLESKWQANLETARSFLNRAANVERDDLVDYLSASRTWVLEKSKLGDMQASFATKQVMLLYRNHTLSIHEEATLPSQAERRPGMAILQGSALGLLLGVVIVALGGRRKAADDKPH